MKVRVLVSDVIPWLQRVIILPVEQTAFIKRETMRGREGEREREQESKKGKYDQNELNHLCDNLEREIKIAIEVKDKKVE